MMVMVMIMIVIVMTCVVKFFLLKYVNKIIQKQKHYSHTHTHTHVLPESTKEFLVYFYCIIF